VGVEERAQDFAELLQTTMPEDAAELFEGVRELCHESRPMWRALARVHPAPFLEYAIKNSAPKSDTFGQPILLAPFHLEGLQTVYLADRGVWVSPRAHGSSEVVRGLSVWWFGTNSDELLRWVAQSDAKAANSVKVIGDYIEFDSEVAEVFPALKLRPEDSKSRRGKMEWTLQRGGRSADPSIKAVGVTNSITGGRATKLVFDDAVDRRNAITQPALMKQIETAVTADWHNLMLPGGQFVWLANTWSAVDMTQKLRAHPLFVDLVHGVGRDLEPLWEAMWPKERLQERLDVLGEWAFELQFGNRIPREGLKIKWDWIRYMEPPPRERLVVIMGVDAAELDDDAADPTAAVFMGVDNIDPGATRHFLRAEQKRLKLLERVDWLISLIKEMDPDIIAFEAKSEGRASAALIENETGIECRLVTPTVSKRLRIGEHAPMFRRGQIWFSPALRPEVVVRNQGPEAADPVSEIMGSINTDNVMDAAEVAIRISVEEFGANPATALPMVTYDQLLAGEIDADELAEIVDQTREIPHDPEQDRATAADGQWWTAPED